MKKNDGKYFERLVELIEKSIESESTIELDVEMPILNSKNGYTTQCDVVITKGIPARKTITIIEVQDRGSKVKPNDYRGWIQKLEDIGAQHLICVSRQPFPGSIKEKAALSGNRVSLINLLNVEADKIPLNFFKYGLTTTDFQISKWKINKIEIKEESIDPIKIKKLFSESNIGTNDKIFSLDKINLLSFHQLAQKTVKSSKSKSTSIGLFNFPLKDIPSLNLQLDGKFIQIGLYVEFEYTLIEDNIPVSLLSYEQDEYGVLAWVLKSKFKINNDDVELKIPIIPNGNNFIIKNLEIESKKGTSMSLDLNMIKGK